MRRIAHLTTVHGRKDVRIFHKECLTLAEAGYEVHEIVADGKGNEQAGPVTIHDIGKSQGRLARMLLKPISMYRAARRLNADVYHFHDPELLPVGMLLCLRGKQVIYDAHEDVPRQILSKVWIASPLRRTISWLFERVEHFAARRLSAIVTATEHIANRLARHNPRTQAIHNYPILSELTATSPEPATLPSKDGRTLCYIGGISATRGAVEMVAALERMDARLLLAGSFETAALQAQLQTMPGWQKVDYRGILPPNEIPALLAQADIGLVLLHPTPSYVESLPIKMFEYMANGVPVLASDFALWRTILGDQGAGRFVDPLNVDAIAQAATALLADTATRQHMADIGRQQVQKGLHWQPEGKHLVALYAQLGLHK